MWRNSSAKSVSVTTFYYTASYFVLCALYSGFQDALSGVFSGVVGALFHIPILLGLWRFKQWLWWEKFLAVLFPLMPLTMALSPPEFRSPLYLLFSIGLLPALAAQPLELWRTKKVGDVGGKLLISYLCATCFWLGYTWLLEDKTLFVVQCFVSAIILTTVTLWVVYWQREHTAIS